MNRKTIAQILLAISMVIMIIYPLFCDLFTAIRICYILQLIFVSTIAFN